MKSEELMRNKTDNCLMCLRNKATKKNSHIIPKFLGIKMLDVGNNRRRGHSISTGKTKNGKLFGEFVQDIPKEDFLVCPTCETKLSIVETCCAPVLKSIMDEDINESKVEIKNEENQEYFEFKELDSIIFHLFVYSLIWRISISQKKVFKNFKLLNNEEEELREILDHNLRDTKVDFWERINSIDRLGFQPHKFTLITSKNIDSKRTCIFANLSSKNPYYILIHKFLLLFGFKNSTDFINKSMVNEDINQSIKIKIRSTEDWNKMMGLLIENIVKKVKK